MACIYSLSKNRGGTCALSTRTACLRPVDVLLYSEGITEYLSARSVVFNLFVFVQEYTVD